MKTNITVLQTDITQISVDIIVNAANETLLGGGGIDGAIHYAAGPMLLEECKTLGGCKTGEAKFTKAYNLSAQYIIHTVGPIYGGENGNEPTLLASCYNNSIKLADRLKAKTIAFPCISTGAFRYPHDEATVIAIETVQNYLDNNYTSLEQIFFVTYSDLDYKLYKQKLEAGTVDIITL
ncbi:MAG: Appr-1-p processing enzyme family protein [Candidatus Amesbacteria bacterium GW2011_GWA2_42_12]|uniref:Appr-1-p processing enzyme family protein n=1 Tax=Candidatus Amesbacteria bacterium GW2011_GWA2_42_12 TaxID=1618356 RepID=A0A0G0Y4B4_9BACT|nr:MAG: Appr-1-p processing enzyme family protein [Candidatus Amesbacteria bacterium GW2011_GWA2_42_12]